MPTDYSPSRRASDLKNLRLMTESSSHQTSGRIWPASSKRRFQALNEHPSKENVEFIVLQDSPSSFPEVAEALHACSEAKKPPLHSPSRRASDLINLRLTAEAPATKPPGKPGKATCKGRSLLSIGAFNQNNKGLFRLCTVISIIT